MPSDPPAAYVPPTAAPAAIGVVFAVPGAPSAPPVPPARPVAAPAAIGAVYAVPGVPAAPPATPAAAAANPQAIGAVFAAGNAPGGIPEVTWTSPLPQGTLARIVGACYKSGVLMTAAPLSPAPPLSQAPPTIPGSSNPVSWIATAPGSLASVYYDMAWVMTFDNTGPAFYSSSSANTPDAIPAGAWHATNNPHGWQPSGGTITGVPAVVFGGPTAPPAITP